MTRCFYDFEFLDEGTQVHPISIGIITDEGETGRQYYAVVEDAPWDRINKHPWLVANVLPVLDRRDYNTKPAAEIGREVKAFMLSGKTPPELWAYFGSYDHFCLTQLFGGWGKWPDSIPQWTNDIKQYQLHVGARSLPRQTFCPHNALADAWHVRTMWRHLNGIDQGQRADPRGFHTPTLHALKRQMSRKLASHYGPGRPRGWHDGIRDVLKILDEDIKLSDQVKGPA